MKELLARKCDAIKSLARFLGGDYKVDVIYDPMGRCMTNGTRILLPIMTDETYTQYEDFLVGLTFHETGHIAHTDFDLYGATKNAIHHTLLNVLDDYRIEILRKEDFKSATYELNNLNDFTTKRNKKKFEDPVYAEALVTEPEAMLWGIGSLIYCKISGIDYSYYPKKLIDIVDKTDDIWEEFKDHVIRERIKGTAKAKEYALKLAERLKEVLVEPPKKKGGEGEEGDEGDGKEGKGKGKGDSKGKGKGKGKGDEDKDKNDEKKAKGEGDAKGEDKSEEGKSLIEEMEKARSKGIHDGIKDELQEVIIQSEKKDIFTHIPHPEALKLDREEFPTYSDDASAQRLYNEMRDNVQADIDAMKTRLLSLLMAKKRVHYLPDSEHGEIDIASVYTLRNGNERIFERLTAGKRLNTAVEILIDCSGSMVSGRKFEGAMQAAIACSETLELLKIPFEITGFTTTSEYYSGGYSEKEFKTYNRFEGLHHFIFKGFDENFHTVKHRLLKISSGNNNGDPESVWWSACRLSKRKEQRKILIVMSDGRPAMSYSCDIRILEAELVKVVQKIIKAGIEVYGIGIYTDAPKKFYPDYSVITKEKRDIATAVYKCLSTKLMNGGTHEI